MPSKSVISVFFICAIFTFFAIISSAAEQNEFPDISAVIDRGSVTVGESVEYRVSLIGKGIEGIEIVLPEKREFYPAPDKNTKEEDPANAVPLYIIYSAKKERGAEEGTDKLSVIMRLSYYRPGKHSLPELELLDSGKTKVGYKIPVIEIKAVNEKGEFAEIEPPMELSGNYTRIIIIVLAAIALVIAGFFLYKYIKKIREAKRNALVPVPPIEIFRDAVNRLGGESLITDGKFDEYVFGVSMIFRRYLSGLFKIEAEEMTTDELRDALKPFLPGGIFKKYENDMAVIFNLWDLSKFAEFKPSDEILISNLNNTIRLAEALNKDLENYAAGI